MDKNELQAKLDIQKWNDSQINGRDMCGEYEYCAFCDKNSARPCANAYVKMTNPQKAKRKKAAKKQPDVTALDNSLGKKFNYSKVVDKKANRKSLTFAEKYALASDVIKDRYEILKDALLSLSKKNGVVKSRISKQCDTYRRNGEIIAKITLIGTSLRVNLPLDCDSPEFNDGKTPHTNMAHKKVYEMVPFQFKVNSKLGVKRALALIDMIK